jgi:hypothetical protein
MGLAIAPGGAGATVFIADSLNNRVRVLEPDGRIATLTGATPVVAPTRLAWHPAGWLYIKDGGATGVTALAAPARPARSLPRPARVDAPRPSRADRRGGE